MLTIALIFSYEKLLYNIALQSSRLITIISIIISVMITIRVKEKTVVITNDRF